MTYTIPDGTGMAAGEACCGCTSDADCQTGLVCHQNRCVEPETVCEDLGAYYCKNEERNLRCRDDGAWCVKRGREDRPADLRCPEVWVCPN